MPKSLPARVAEANAVENERAALMNVIPTALVVSQDTIVSEVMSLREQANKALAVAERAEIKAADDAGNAADVLRAISQLEKKADAQRKVHTGVLDKLFDKIKKKYDEPIATAKKAKDLLMSKVNTWRRAEEERLTKEYEERQRGKDEEARKLAEQQAALGDEDGADQILEEAAALDTGPEKIQATGVYGTSLGSRTVSVGKITDMRKFLQVLATSKAPEIEAVLEAVEVGQAALNRLAKQVNDGEVLSPAGFEASKKDSSTYR